MKNNYFIQNKIYLSYLSFFLGFALLLSLITYLMSVYYNQNVDDIFKKEAKVITELKLEKFNDTLNLTTDILNAIKNNQFFVSYLQDNSSETKSYLNNLFLTTLNSNKNIYQLRYISKFGDEIIRVQKDKNSKTNILVEDKKLQNKSYRYYFYKTRELKDNQIFLSNLDLNVEHEEIEKPIRPMLRISTPVYINKKVEGILIINLEMEHILEDFVHSTLFDFSIVDRDGYIVFDSKEKYIFSKYLSENSYFDVQKVYKKSIENILNNNNKDIYLRELYSSKYIKNEDLYILVKSNKLFKENTEKEQQKYGIYLLLIMLGIAFPLASLISIYPTKMKNELHNVLKESNENLEIIDKYVLITETDKTLKITNVSKAIEVLSGYSKEELIGKKHNIFKSNKNSPELYEQMWSTLKDKKHWTGEIINKKKNGELYWLETTIIPLYNEQNKIKGYKSFSIDITDKKELERISITDNLTKAFNRVKIDSVLEQELHNAQRYNHIFSIIIADIDKFKLINDVYGHQVGDSVLREFSNLLMTNIRNTDIFGRWGGEEFIIICPNTNVDDAFILAEKLREKIKEFNFKTVGKVTSSFGVSTYSNGDDIHSIIYKSDMALYESKENGRDRVTKKI